MAKLFRTCETVVNSSQRRMSPKRRAKISLFTAVFMILAACSNLDVTVPEDLVSQEDEERRAAGTIFGEGNSISDLFRGGTGRGGGAGSTLGVNSFLWRATLDTISIWPINSADPFGGVIITDWFSPPETPGERFKVNVFILGRALRADGVRVSLFRQVRDSRGEWRDATVLPASSTRLEDSILTRARQFRNETLQK